MKQWMLRITAYAERLLDDLDGLDWPEGVLTMQREWIGRSRAPRSVRGRRPAGEARQRSTVFTTRPDTLFGAPTWCSRPSTRWWPQHHHARAQRAAVEAYVTAARNRSRPHRQAADARRPACSPAPTPSTRSTAPRSRSGSPTTC
jgi:leucyl-tRNA synthetase